MRPVEKFLKKTGAILGFTYGITQLETLRRQLLTGNQTWVNRCLTPCEQETFRKFTVLKRKTEWLGGRLAAKQACRRYLGLHQPGEATVTVLNDGRRAPYLAEYPGLTLSISHAGDYAVAILAGFPVGIDLEQIRSLPETFQNCFLSSEERNRTRRYRMQPEKSDSLATCFWTRKEAVAKVLKQGGNLNFQKINTAQNVIVPDPIPDAPVVCRIVRMLSARCGTYYCTVAFCNNRVRGLE
jgi:phosphopantetheinyl transferase